MAFSNQQGQPHAVYNLVSTDIMWVYCFAEKKKFIFRFPWVVSSRETCFMHTQISHSSRGIDENTGNQIKSASLKKYDQGGEGIGSWEPSLFCYGGNIVLVRGLFLKTFP